MSTTVENNIKVVCIGSVCLSVCLYVRLVVFMTEGSFGWDEVLLYDNYGMTT